MRTAPIPVPGPQSLPPEFAASSASVRRAPRRACPSSSKIEHGIGSGVILSPDGYILTNNHVVDGSMKINVTLNDRRVFPAKLVGVDKLNDLAVIKIEREKTWPPSPGATPLNCIPVKRSSHSAARSATSSSPSRRGIVSALNRPNPYTDDPANRELSFKPMPLSNPGNSGGPLVNAHGELVGSTRSSLRATAHSQERDSRSPRKSPASPPSPS